MKRKKIFLLLVSLTLLILVVFLLYTPEIPVEKLKNKYCSSESEFTTVEDIKVHYRREGTGTNILFIHGTGSSLHTWDAYTSSLKDSFEIIRLDLPGFGLTGPFANDDYTIDHYTRFLDAFIHSIDLDTFVIAGNSLGGEIALAYALNYPSKIISAILIDPAGAPSDAEPAFIFKLARIPVINLFLKLITPKSFVEKNLKEVYFDDSKIDDQLINRYYELTLRQGNRQAFIDRAKAKSHTFTQESFEADFKTLVMWGKEDLWIDYAQAEFFLKLPDSELALIEKCGHVPMEECPETSLPYIKRFLNQ